VIGELERSLAVDVAGRAEDRAGGRRVPMRMDVGRPPVVLVRQRERMDVRRPAAGVVVAHQRRLRHEPAGQQAGQRRDGETRVRSHRRGLANMAARMATTRNYVSLARDGSPQSEAPRALVEQTMAAFRPGAALC